MTWTAPPGWKKLRAKIFATKGRTCVWCGDVATTIDHVTPIAAGGGHDISNLVPACRRCNYSRGASFGNRRRGPAPVYWPVPTSRRW